MAHGPGGCLHRSKKVIIEKAKKRLANFLPEFKGNVQFLSLWACKDVEMIKRVSQATFSLERGNFCYGPTADG